MKKTIVLVIACAAIALFSQCSKKTSTAGSKKTKTETVKKTDKNATTPQEAQEVANLKNSMPATQISKGEQIFRNNCAKCHELKQPGTLTVHKWNKVLPEMMGKAQLNNSDAATLKTWVLTNAKEG